MDQFVNHAVHLTGAAPVNLPLKGNRLYIRGLGAVVEGGVQAKGVVVQVLADLPARLGMVPLPAEAEEGEKAAAAAQEPAVLFSSPGGKG